MMKKKHSITIKNFNRIYSNKQIFRGLDLRINKGEFLCILGPNGCGKSTLLNSIAGLIEHNGSIETHSDNIGLVGQNTSEMLLPWLSIESNLVFPLEKKNADSKLLNQLLRITQLKEHNKKYPYQLSSGMAQLTLIARALMNKSDIILLDEPFRSLDFTMANKMQMKVLDLWSKYRPTVVMVSHDIDEAIFMGDRIIVLSDKPTVIKKSIDIVLPRPRDFGILTTEEFIKIKQEVVNAFNN